MLFVILEKKWIKEINLTQFHDITFQFYKSNNINFIHFNLMKGKDTRGHPIAGSQINGEK